MDKLKKEQVNSDHKLVGLGMRKRNVSKKRFRKMKQFVIHLSFLIFLTFLLGCSNEANPLSFEIINIMQPDSSSRTNKIYSVYVTNFCDNNKNWEALEDYGKKSRKKFE